MVNDYVPPLERVGQGVLGAQPTCSKDTEQKEGIF